MNRARFNTLNPWLWLRVTRLWPALRRRAIDIIITDKLTAMRCLPLKSLRITKETAIIRFAVLTVVGVALSRNLWQIQAIKSDDCLVKVWKMVRIEVWLGKVTSNRSLTTRLNASLSTMYPSASNSKKAQNAYHPPPTTKIDQCRWSKLSSCSISRDARATLLLSACTTKTTKRQQEAGVLVDCNKIKSETQPLLRQGQRLGMCTTRIESGTRNEIGVLKSTDRKASY